MQDRVALGLIEPLEPKTVLAESGFELTSRGEAFANASAAKPGFRKTAETLLQQFLERLDTVNSSPDYVYRVERAVLFGSMLSEAERLGDVDIAIELLPKVPEKAEFRKCCDRRRYAAREQGKSFRSSFDWIFRPREEIFESLRGAWTSSACRVATQTLRRGGKQRDHLASNEFKIEDRVLCAAAEARCAKSVRRIRRNICRNISTVCDAFPCIFGEAHTLRFAMRSDVQLIEKKGQCSQAKESAGTCRNGRTAASGSAYRFESLERSWKLNGIL